MDSLVVYISASLSVLAISFAAVSLVLHWIRRAEPPDVTQVRSELNALRLDHADLLDKFTHQIKRDRVRRLRASKENEPSEEEQVDLIDPDRQKVLLRRRAFGLSGGG